MCVCVRVCVNRHDLTGRLDTERERSHVDEEDF